MFDDCIKTISQYAFSEKGIVNYNDPLFLFLNLKQEIILILKIKYMIL